MAIIRLGNMLAPTGGTVEEQVDRAVKAIEYIRANDCDFLTVETIQAYANVDAGAAERGLRRVMGDEWFDGKGGS